MPADETVPESRMTIRTKLHDSAKAALPLNQARTGSAGASPSPRKFVTVHTPAEHLAGFEGVRSMFSARASSLVRADGPKNVPDPGPRDRGDAACAKRSRILWQRLPAWVEPGSKFSACRPPTRNSVEPRLCISVPGPLDIGSGCIAGCSHPAVAIFLSRGTRPRSVRRILTCQGVVWRKTTQNRRRKWPGGHWHTPTPCHASATLRKMAD